jgi:hypothetical protein
MYGEAGGTAAEWEEENKPRRCAQRNTKAIFSGFIPSSCAFIAFVVKFLKMFLA